MIIEDTKGEGGELQVTSRLVSGTVTNTLGDDAGDTGLMPWETAFGSPDVLRDNMGDIGGSLLGVMASGTVANTRGTVANTGICRASGDCVR